MATEIRLCSKTMSLTGLSPMKTSHFKVENMKMLGQRLSVKSRKLDKPCPKRRVVVLASPMSNSDVGSNFVSLSNTIERFYDCINKNKFSQLGEFISDDCELEDCSFPNTFEGKKDVINFFTKLMTSMGQNVEFKIGNICIGDDFVAGVYWHLEWNKKRIPFTRGCSFYKCSTERTRLVIKKCLIVTELPMKPGDSALNLMRVMSTLFDKFPKAAEWFLKSHQELLQKIIKIYSMFLRPLISPVLAWYINLWKLIGRLLSNVLGILITISKILYK